MRRWIVRSSSTSPPELTLQQGNQMLVRLEGLAGQMVVRISLGDNTVLDEGLLPAGEPDRIRGIRRGPEGYPYRLVPGADVARQGRARAAL